MSKIKKKASFKWNWWEDEKKSLSSFWHFAWFTVPERWLSSWRRQQQQH